ncbi:MAG: MBL fold metallo-hydrolase [Actinomycetota bacterium]|nr:MBL fold metallo-hydrolase [Actinomycetota bacterium]
MEITYIGGPTALIEVGGLRLLTDPVFDPPGGKYSFGLGTGSQKLAGPALAAGELGRIDAVLLSHDHHADNLDPAGRALLPSAGRVVTTSSGAKRLGGNALGLDPWASTTLQAPDGPEVKVTATPARHGPPLSHPLVGDVIGFVLEWEGQRDGAFWISGDTVYYRGVGEVGERFDVGTALIHLGGVRFPISGPARYTMNAREAARVCGEFGLKTLLPIHYEGWKHFREGRADAEQAFATAGVAERVRWLPAGRAETVDV